MSDPTGQFERFGELAEVAAKERRSRPVLGSGGGRDSCKDSKRKLHDGAEVDTHLSGALDTAGIHNDNGAPLGQLTRDRRGYLDHHVDWDRLAIAGGMLKDYDLPTMPVPFNPILKGEFLRSLAEFDSSPKLVNDRLGSARHLLPASGILTG